MFSSTVHGGQNTVVSPPVSREAALPQTKKAPTPQPCCTQALCAALPCHVRNSGPSASVFRLRVFCPALQPVPTKSSKAQSRVSLPGNGRCKGNLVEPESDHHHSQRQDFIQRKWYVIHATGQTLGRLASHAASVLAGKTNPLYTPYIDMGDHVVVINAEKIHLTGMKAGQKLYRRYTGFPRRPPRKRSSMRKLLVRQPAAKRFSKKAIKGMLPKSKMGRQMATKLKVYKGADHPHHAQQPVALEMHRTGMPQILHDKKPAAYSRQLSGLAQGFQDLGPQTLGPSFSNKILKGL